MANLLKNPQDHVFEAVIRFVKIAFILIGIATAVFAAERLAAPYYLDLLSYFHPGPWITVQLIIIVVWKLSGDQRQADQRMGEDKPQYIPPVIKEGYFEIFPAIPLDLKPSSEISDDIPHSPTISGKVPPESDATAPDPVLRSGDSPPDRSFHAPCISTDSDDKRVSSRLETKKSTKPPAPESVRPTEGGEDEDEDEGGRNSIDATWKAIVDGGAATTRPILRKSDTWEGSPHVEAPTAAGRELRKSSTFREKAAAPESGWRRREALVVSRDELMGRVEAFIETHYDHLRLQRQESEQRRELEHRRFMKMVNHAY